MKTSQSSRRRLGLALACCVITLAVSAQGKKPVKPPPGPPVDTGVIYAHIEGDIYALQPDGSEEQYLFTLPSDVREASLVPSLSPCFGERWFVGWQEVEGTYPDGETGRVRLIAMSESGASVVLHDDVMLQPSCGSYSPLRWVPGDSAVSWLALRWEAEEGEEYVGEWGVYTLDLQFTADGPVAAELPFLLDWTSGLFELWYEEPPSPWREGYYLLADDYDWSPDGSAIVYSAWSEAAGTQLYAAGATGDPVQLTSDVDTYPTDPRWSPDGTRIVFKLNQQHQIDVIDLGTAERSTLITTSLTDYREQVFCPRWSPASTHVVYCYYTYHQRKGARDALHVIAADGSGDTPLTSSYTFVHPLGWCAEE